MAIVLERSDTLIGRAGRIVTGYPYTHIAVTFDLNHFYSFSRRYHHNPFDAGFTIERPSYYACLGDTTMKAYYLDITDAQLKDISRFNASIGDLPFDIYGMILMPAGIYRKKENAYNCMTYVAKVLELSGVRLINDPWYRNNIRDLEQALIKHGCRQDTVSFRYEFDEEYMRRCSFRERMCSFIDIHKKLLKSDK